jgi:hypothetical protein
MKKLLAVAVGLLMVIGLAACSGQSGFYGTYTFGEVSYLSPVSSATVDYLNEKMLGTKYTIEQDIFLVEFADAQIEFASPTYQKEPIPTAQNVLSDASCVIGNEIEYQYTIYKADGTKSGWRLYVSSNTLWVSSFADNTADNSEIILNIFELSPNF